MKNLFILLLLVLPFFLSVFCSEVDVVVAGTTTSASSSVGACTIPEACDAIKGALEEAIKASKEAQEKLIKCEKKADADKKDPIATCATQRTTAEKARSCYLMLNQAQQRCRNVKVSDILAIEGQKNFNDSAVFFGQIINLLVKFVGTVALVFIVIGGFRLLFAAGNDNEIQKAKTMITYSIIGLVLVLMAYLIVAFVRGILYS